MKANPNVPLPEGLEYKLDYIFFAGDAVQQKGARFVIERIYENIIIAEKDEQRARRSRGRKAQKKRGPR